MSSVHLRKRLGTIRSQVAKEPQTAKHHLKELIEEIEHASNLRELQGGNLGDEVRIMQRILQSVPVRGDLGNMLRCSRCQIWTSIQSCVRVKKSAVCRPCAEGRRCSKCLRNKTPERDCRSCSGRGRSGWVIPTAFENNRARH